MMCILIGVFLLIGMAASEQNINSKLYAAASKNSANSLQTMIDLVKSGADLHALTTDGESILHLACIYGHANKVQYLLDEGVDPNRRNMLRKESLSMTPLSWCVYGNHLEAVNMFLTNPKTEVNSVFTMEDGSEVTVLNIALRLGEMAKGMVESLRGAGGLLYLELMSKYDNDLNAMQHLMPPVIINENNEL